MSMRYKWVCLLLCGLLLCGCAPAGETEKERPSSGGISAVSGEAEESEEAMSETAATYAQISQEEAKRLLDEGGALVLLDVREQEEYDAGHIPGAILMPYTRAEELAPTLLPDKGATILVYCRSGRRSKIAAQTLADLGYTDVREFGGIIDWKYEITEAVGLS